jgi:hypothetical protein
MDIHLTGLQLKRRANQLRLWSDPVYRANQMSKRRDLQWRKQMSASVIIAVNHPGVQAKWRGSYSQYLQKPGVHESLVARAIEVASRPSVKAKKSEFAKCLWESLDYREKQKQARDTAEWKSAATARGKEIGARSDVRQKRITRLAVVMKGKGKGHPVSIETRAAISKGQKRSKAFCEKLRASRLGKRLPPLVYAKIAKRNQDRVLQGDCWKKGVFNSLKNGKSVIFQSSYELALFEKLEGSPNVVRFMRCPFAVDYCISGKTHKYIPDVLVEYKDGLFGVVEVKAKSFVNAPVNQAKFSAAIDICKQKGYRFSVVTEDDLFHHSQIETAKESQNEP